MHRTCKKFIVVSAVLSAVAGGCASSTPMSDEGLLNTSKALAVPVFQAPYDPGMSRVGVQVSPVELAAAEAGLVGDLARAVRAQLVGAMVACPNFLVTDREAMAEIAAEQRLNLANATLAGGRPMMQQLVPPRYLVKVTVTELKESVHGRSKGGRIELGPLFQIGGMIAGGEAGKWGQVGGIVNPTIARGNETVEGLVGLDVRVIDIESGVVVGATRAVAKLQRKNSKTVLGIAGISASDAQFSESVVAQASRAAVEEASRQVHLIIRNQVVSSPVAANTGG